MPTSVLQQSFYSYIIYHVFMVFTSIWQNKKKSKAVSVLLGEVDGILSVFARQVPVLNIPFEAYCKPDLWLTQVSMLYPID